MKIGITGGCGFVGTNLALHLAQQGYKVCVFDCSVSEGIARNREKEVINGATWLLGDVRDREEMEELKSCQVILHCAGLVSSAEGEDNPNAYFQTNTLGTANVLEMAREHGQAVIYWSSSKVYSSRAMNRYVATIAGWTADEEFSVDGGDRSIYGTTKLLGDLLCQEYAQAYGLRIWVNRFGCLYGPHQWGRAAQGWVSWFVIAAELGLPVELFGWGGKQVRDVLYIDDLLNLIDKQLECIDQADGSVFNVGGGPANAVTPLELIQVIQEATGKELKYTIQDAPRRADFESYVSDIRKVQNRFGWQPAIGFRLGVVCVHEWVKANRDALEKMHRVRP